MSYTHIHVSEGKPLHKFTPSQQANKPLHSHPLRRGNGQSSIWSYASS